MRLVSEGSAYGAPAPAKKQGRRSFAFVVPAKAGTHSHRSGIWTPAFAGATQDNKGPPCSASSCSASSPSPRPPSRSARRRHRRPPTRRAIPRSRCSRPAPPSWARSCAIRRRSACHGRDRHARARPTHHPAQTRRAAIRLYPGGRILGRLRRKGVRIYKPGESFMEAMDVCPFRIQCRHVPAKLIAVYMGANGRKGCRADEVSASARASPSSLPRCPPPVHRP